MHGRTLAVLGFDVERRFSKLLGLDLALGDTRLTTESNHSVGSGTQSDDLGVLPIWLALNFHVFNDEQFDFQTDNECPSLGFLVGADFTIAEDWAVNFAFRFQDADADSNHDLPLDPTFVTLGISRSLSARSTGGG